MEKKGIKKANESPSFIDQIYVLATRLTSNFDPQNYKNYAISFAHFLFCLVQVSILTDHNTERPSAYLKLEFLLRGLEFVPAYQKFC
jgi:hypothetical protein